MDAITNHVWGESRAADRVWAQVCGLRPSVAGSRRFMVIQAYIDESVDDDSGTFVLAGYIASAERWASFSKEWEEMLPRGTRNKYGNFHFKMSEMAGSPERMSRVSGFHNIIHRHAEALIFVLFNIKDLQHAVDRIFFENVYQRVGQDVVIVADMEPWRNPYFFAYRMMMDAFHDTQLDRPGVIPFDQPVDFYFDDRAEKSQILAAWDEYIGNMPEEKRKLFGAAPRFENDEAFLPLQAADFRAWWLRKWAVENGYDKVNDGKYEFSTQYLPMSGIRITVDEEQITNRLKDIAQSSLPDGVFARDKGPAEQVDPEPMLLKLFRSLMGKNKPK